MEKLFTNSEKTSYGIIKVCVRILKNFLKNHKSLKDKFQRNVNELEYKIKN